MTKKYIVVDYKSGKSEKPVIAAEFVSLNSAEEKFEQLKTANQKRSVVLFDTQTAEVGKIAILGEPIYLAKAIAFARTFVVNKATLKQVEQGAFKAGASSVIEKIAAALAGGRVTSNAVAFTKAAIEMYGGFSGAIIGFVIGGPIGAIVGGVVGSVGIGQAAGALVKYDIEHPKCEDCSATGLVGYYEVCDTCKGYGYKK